MSLVIEVNHLEPTMKSEKRTEYVTRDSILTLLSDDELASVSTAETAARLSRGDQYIDLTNLDQGVRRALGRTPPLGHVLPRKAVRDKTWKTILAQLNARVIAKPHSGRAKRNPVPGAGGAARANPSKSTGTKHKRAPSARARRRIADARR